MGNRRLILIAATVAVASATSACGHRCSGQDGSAECAERAVEQVSRHMDLNGEQRAKLDVVKTKLLTVRDAASRQREKDKQEVLALLSQPVLDRSRAESLVRSRTEAVEEMAPEIIEAVGAFYDSLTPEQQRMLR